ncbi:SURF1 family protein [Pseudoroseicyclus aestuarii]|uniref:SURF1-like protein n=1 Tax=Pseudoroseicyclus aestuarii TaxID=1795041 RepID=A0A318SXD0_9RHOB|nr:SURF1 family protein [Pseudoroseicyclus aestuarii]PYE84999.1 surfeit locus 1 family protein [Pseudoroseicyclus aestuarii]
MIRRLIFPLLIGVLGCAALLVLGLWQVQRLAWKQGILSQIESRMAADPVPLDTIPDPDPEADRYRPVTVTGRLTGEEAPVLTSDGGAGYRVIAVLETGARRVLVDLGFVPLDAKDSPRTGTVSIAGTLHWPQEADGWTPDPSDDNIWFARDVPRMAEALGTEPVLVVARQVAPDVGTRVLPVNTAAIPNDHLHYAITWFMLALLWAAMSLYLGYRALRAGPKE